jgi:hypothetical protein
MEVFENNIMKPSKNCKKWRGKIQEGENFIKVHYMNVQKYHNETQVQLIYAKLKPEQNFAGLTGRSSGD